MNQRVCRPEVLKFQGGIFCENFELETSNCYNDKKSLRKQGTILKYFHSKKELYDEIGNGNAAGAVLEEYCEDKSIPPTEMIRTLRRVLEMQFTENMNRYREKLKEEEFRQNFDIFRLPVFRSEAEMLEKILIRRNEEGVWNIRL